MTAAVCARAFDRSCSRSWAAKNVAAVTSPLPVNVRASCGVETSHAPADTVVRCEYCHDPVGTSRFEYAGHVGFGAKYPQLVARAKTLECAGCHSDHHGRDVDLRRVDPRDCAS